MEVLTWHLESVVRGGAAGTIFFAWTDEWFTGGHDITDWAFGLVTRERQPKKAFHALKPYLELRRLDHRAGEAAVAIRRSASSCAPTMAARRWRLPAIARPGDLSGF